MELSKPETGVHVTGYVKDITPYLEKAGMMIVSLRAWGEMRVKILEALAFSLHVVSTTLGREGIALENGRHTLIANIPGELVRAILKLLDNQTLADELSRDGRNLIESICNYRLAYLPLDKIYQQ